MRSLLGMANADIKVAEIAFSLMEAGEAYKRIGCFHTEQAIEKSLRYILKKLNIGYIFNGDLQLLIDSIECNGIAIPKTIKDRVYTLNKWYVITNCLDSVEILNSDLEYMLGVAKSFLKFTREIKV